MRSRRLIGDIILYVVVVIGFIASIYPVYWMFVAGTQNNQQIFGKLPYLWFGSSLLQNYKELMTNSGINIYQSILNSLIISLSSTVLAVISASMAGYAFAKYHFKLS